MTKQVIAVVDDIFFASKIRGTAEQAGITVAFPRSTEAALEAAKSSGAASIICDLNSLRVDPFELARKLKQDPATSSVPLLGFFAHVQTELQRQAVEAGFDRVVPRSVFARDLTEIIQGDIGIADF
jgi:CheY-like chemotaxis protein